MKYVICTNTADRKAKSNSFETKLLRELKKTY